MSLSFRDHMTVGDRRADPWYLTCLRALLWSVQVGLDTGDGSRRPVILATVMWTRVRSSDATLICTVIHHDKAHTFVLQLWHHRRCVLHQWCDGLYHAAARSF